MSKTTDEDLHAAFQLTIEGHPFHAVHEVGCAEHLKGVLEAGHGLNLRAGLRAAVRRAAAEDLVRAEQALDLALVFVQHSKHVVHLLRVLLTARHAVRHGGPAHRALGVVHAVVVRVPAVDVGEGELDTAVAVVVAQPVHALLREESRGVHQHLGRARRAQRHHLGLGAVLGHVVVDDVLADLDERGPARLGPLDHGILDEQLRLLGQVGDHRLGDGLLLLRPELRVHEERAQHVERVPQPVAVVVAGLVDEGADPAVRRVGVRQHVAHQVVDDRAEVRLHAPGGLGRLQQAEQRHLAVRPVRQPLIRAAGLRAVAAGPRAHVDVVSSREGGVAQVARERVGLQQQLLEQPALRRDGPDRRPLELLGRQRRSRGDGVPPDLAAQIGDAAALAERQRQRGEQRQDGSVGEPHRRRREQ